MSYPIIKIKKIKKFESENPNYVFPKISLEEGDIVDFSDCHYSPELVFNEDLENYGWDRIILQEFDPDKKEALIEILGYNGQGFTNSEYYWCEIEILNKEN